MEKKEKKKKFTVNVLKRSTRMTTDENPSNDLFPVYVK